MSTILVTGGSGFIGSNFITHMLSHYPDKKIVNLDKLTYAGNPDNLTSVENNPKYTFVHGDICDAKLVFHWMKKVDEVVHFAAESHVDRSIEDGSVFVTTNVLGTQTLLDAALSAKISRFVHVSTDEVYGSLGEKGFFDEHSPLKPNSPYSASKAGSDLLVRSFFKTHGFPGIITRCSNNYGPYQFPEKLIPLMITNALEDKPLPVYGDGMNIRDWLHVQDHCRAIDLVLTKGKPGEVYNIGGGNEWHNIDIVKLILKELKKPESLIRFVKDRPGHDRRYAIDATKIRWELGWRPEIDFRDGIIKTIQWYKDNTEWIRRIKSGDYQKSKVHTTE